MKFLTLAVIGCLVFGNCIAQTSETQAWLFINHSQRLTDKFDVLADVQVRSANDIKFLNTLLLRSALNFHLNKKHAVALGYAFKVDREFDETGEVRTTEHRAYEQYQHDFKVRKTEMALRLRFEQRWIKEDAYNFSQRGRIFYTVQIPLLADTGFTKGLFAGLQNELFLNLQNKKAVNGRVFDQNRTFGSLGYKLSKNIDTELGYMFWFQHESDGPFKRHIIQFVLTTNF
ncbi:DUF2490 domain-containing protein [Mucilaginibacter aquatilis]|uniref:DUF2490 domain-containing protein n=1 Tax=Mucilaginibacter aquatilis TaxID=1517760 RepID=A0A6I4ICD9_9SPHI|nr:DUF2490 domain-containing protein [Mucilaginibacter aquatilis]MVN92915.1 DUF2490 domain-containing protein [Mucilaginibacter aquatilis]